jgi:glycosyltransferase involved in cell wall biosynthesis
MDAILSANVSHYVYAAQALQGAGILKRYLCSIGIQGQNPWFSKWLPKYWRLKLTGRNLNCIDKKRIKIIWFAEAVQRLLPALRIITRERGDWLCAYLFDLLSWRWVDTCDIFHFVSSIGFYSARKAKKSGSLVICDVRSEYPDYQASILADEYTLMGIQPPSGSFLLDRKVKAEFKLSDYLIVPSCYAKNTYLQAGYEPANIFVVPYGVDLKQFSPDMRSERNDPAPLSSIRNHPFRIIFTGQIQPRKGVRYLLEAFKRLNLRNSELLLIGGVDQSMAPILENAITEDSRIHAVGHVPRAELPSLYKTGSVFVFPSLADAWGLVVFEAMASGLPAIVTENTGSKEAVQQGQTGFVVPIRDVDAISDKLHYLYTHPETREEMGAAASLSALEYSWENYGRKLMTVYQEIAKIRSIPIDGISTQVMLR